MRRIGKITALTAALLVLAAVPAGASHHELVCSPVGDGQVSGVADHAARSDDIGYPPGITPHDPDDLLGAGFPNFDVLGAADHNPNTYFRPLIAIKGNPTAAEHALKNGTCP